MNWFHTHDWKETQRYTTSPVQGVSIKSISEQLVERLSFGFTTIELTCKTCGDIKSEILLGCGSH